ncbi:12540_t:CDS:2, partial [Dentiscutata erythropus]
MLEKYESVKEDIKLNILGTIHNEEIVIAIVIENKNALICELEKDIEAFNLQNRMNILEYINYIGKKDIKEVLNNQEI